MFFRTDRSIIVNIVRIVDMHPGAHGEYSVTLRNGTGLKSGQIYSSRLRAMASNAF
jgi:DNA-binding LytR/AlgR family response regulator